METTIKNTMSYPTTVHKRWKVFINKPFRNCDKIYPIQQKKVEAFIESVKDNENVVKVIVFGSSVTEACHTGSDVDLYVELEKNERLKLPRLRFDYDLWTNFNVDERIYGEIMKKGVVVYEKDIT